MKNFLLLALSITILSIPLSAQQRDRRVDLNVMCGYRITVSPSGQLWLFDRCGHICKADSIGASWRTLLGHNNYGPRIEHVAIFGNDTIIAAGYMPGNFVLRSTTGGHVWDTVVLDKDHTWAHGFCQLNDGKLWITSAKGRSFKTMSFSNDRGATFTSLHPLFPDRANGEDGIEELYMLSADSGFAGAYGNRIYSTSDNWRTVHRMATPQDQGLVECKDNGWVSRLRAWHGLLIATQNKTTAFSPLRGEATWKKMPIRDFETDLDNDLLWALTDSGQLVLMHDDMEHWTVVKENTQADYICGAQAGRVFVKSPVGVVRIAPDGKSDTCGFFTEEQSLQDYIDAMVPKDGIGYNPLTKLNHGGRMWLTDCTSIYLRDFMGWYRIAKPDGIANMSPDPDRDDRVIILHNRQNYTVDTAGRIEPYSYRDPFAAFLQSGLHDVTIQTYSAGCFHFQRDRITYTRKGNTLAETKYSVAGKIIPKDRRRRKQRFEVQPIEEALKWMSDHYSIMPSAVDFGLKEGSVDLQKVFDQQHWCTSSNGFEVAFVNNAGDTLWAYGNSSVDCGEYFPMLLPMIIKCGDATMFSFRPELWNTLKPLMPEKMYLRSMLNKFSLIDIRPGDLLFFRDSAGMGSAVQQCTGEYSHVAIVESVGDSIWIIDATQRHGVSRHALQCQPGDSDFPAVYRCGPFHYIDVEATLDKARSFIGRPYDNAFEPGTDALYCSELVYECYLKDYSDDKGNPLFDAKPMNWRDANGNIPQYWIDHFKALGKPIPEGLPGTNPTDLSRSEKLTKIF